MLETPALRVRFYACEQMLQKAGWNEGKGLGVEEQGITKPVNRGNTTDGTGIGEVKPAVVQKDDDAFMQYRKRMQLAYKYRPNPLVSILSTSVPPKVPLASIPVDSFPVHIVDKVTIASMQWKVPP